MIGEGDGFIFESGNKIELEVNINKAFSCQWNNEKIKEKSIERFSSERYFELIQKLYK